MSPTDPRASYLADPTIQALTVLLREISKGLLVFPRFQRPFVWREDKRIELVRTILKGLPIGTFMTWRTAHDIGAFDRIGPWRMPQQAATVAGRQYVLDGLQRLTTLYVVLTPDKEKMNTPDVGWSKDPPRDMFVDLANPDVDVFERDDDDESQTSRLSRSIPLADFLDSKRLLQEQRKLQRQSDADALLDRSDRVAEVLRNYKVPVVPFVSDDIDVVTRAFQLVNSQGTPMSPVHMVNALAWREDFRLLDVFDDFRRNSLAEVGWEDLDEVVLLRCFALAVGVSSHDFDVADFAKRLRDDHRGVTERVGVILCTIARVLRRVCHIRVSSLVPYSTQIVVLFGALQERPELSAEQRAIVGHWLWYTSYVEAFSGSISGSFVTRTIDRLKQALDGKSFQWEARKTQLRRFPADVDFRHGRARVFALRLARKHAQVEKTRQAYRLLAESGAKALANVVPLTARGVSRFGRGARVVASQQELPKLRSALSGEFDRDLAKKYVIPEKAWAAYREERFQEFVSIRDAVLAEDEKSHFARVRRALHIDKD